VPAVSAAATPVETITQTVLHRYPENVVAFKLLP
jgi:hypothetical protein